MVRGATLLKTWHGGRSQLTPLQCDLGPPAVCVAVTEAIGDFCLFRSQLRYIVRAPRYRSETWSEGTSRKIAIGRIAAWNIDLPHSAWLKPIASCTASGRGRGKGNETVQHSTYITVLQSFVPRLISLASTFKVLSITPRAHAQSNCRLSSQASKFGADHDNEGSKHFWTSLEQ